LFYSTVTLALGSLRIYVRIELSIELTPDGGSMSEMRAGAQVASVVGVHAWLILAVVAVPILLVCVTAIIMVLSVEPADRVTAIKALAPVLALTKASDSFQRELGDTRPTEELTNGANGGR
jgi:hypothetical protein